MKYPHQVDKQTLIIATGTYGRFAAGIAGHLKKIEYKSDTVAVGDCTLDVLLNGTTIYGSPSDRPKILNGQQAVTITLSDLTLDPAIAEMDLFELVATLAGGSIGNAFYTQLIIETADVAGSGSGSITFDDGGPDDGDGNFIFDGGAA